MSGKKLTAFTLISLLTIGVLVIGCDEDSNYDQRTVVYASNINEGVPYFSDVLNQGDSLFKEDGVTPIASDDYVEEDWIKIQFHNKPYSTIIDPSNNALGDFLVTGYDVEFARLDGGTTPVPPFLGKTSVLVPVGSMVEAYIILVPFYAKNDSPLFDLRYTGIEIMTHAHITFHGHEIISGNDVDFSASISVNFADPLCREKKN